MICSALCIHIISNKDLTLQFVRVSSNNCISFQAFSFGLLKYLYRHKLEAFQWFREIGETICLMSLSICNPLHQENFRFWRLSVKLDILYLPTSAVFNRPSQFHCYLSNHRYKTHWVTLLNCICHKALQANKVTEAKCSGQHLESFFIVRNQKIRGDHWPSFVVCMVL